MPETDLYEPVKQFLESLGYEVKAEVANADIAAVKGDDLVIVELKTGFNLGLLRQAVARQALTDHVYVAVPKWGGRDAWRTFKGNVGLCKRLGIGVLSVDGRVVRVHADPQRIVPRKSHARKHRLMREFARREGDPNQGGTNGKIVTAYRQDAIKCADYLREHGPTKGSVVAKATGVQHATRIMRDNHYGWFEKVSVGVYRFTG